ncbi:hypothetical protein [Streptomyces paromomycinus]|uniref:Uncharacterized protein n=1 Tax=Streptomyces paromomycinus TaxID=92743 RepID=A0A401VXK0_STREY|nr:hypothetical protein [Streptomyces paromomycinus]GCD41797.1 hypothetical protein GKJPGBOP_01454 [Streptomyces paromomycinus]
MSHQPQPPGANRNQHAVTFQPAPLHAIAQGNWQDCLPPLWPREARRAKCTDAMLKRIIGVHRIEPWLAERLVQPMLAELLSIGLWKISGDGMYAGLWPGPPGAQCHCVLFNPLSKAIFSYGTHHGEYDCGVSLPARAPRLWLPAPRKQEGFPPPGLDLSGWRHVLRASATSPVRITWPALEDFAARTSGRPLAPHTLGSTYLTAAGRAHRLAPVMNSLPQRHDAYWIDDQGPLRLRWRVAVEPHQSKPTVTQIRTADGPVTRVRAHGGSNGTRPAGRPRPHQ